MPGETTLRLSPENQAAIIGRDVVILAEAKALKATVVLKPDDFRLIAIPQHQQTVRIQIAVPGAQSVHALVRAKAMRKVITAVAGGNASHVILSGKLIGNEIFDGGLTIAIPQPIPVGGSGR